MSLGLKLRKRCERFLASAYEFEFLQSTAVATLVRKKIFTAFHDPYFTDLHALFWNFCLQPLKRLTTMPIMPGLWTFGKSNAGLEIFKP
jgi:hypothetical protein